MVILADIGTDDIRSKNVYDVEVSIAEVAMGTVAFAASFCRLIIELRLLVEMGAVEAAVSVHVDTGSLLLASTACFLCTTRDRDNTSVTLSSY